jgi:methyl-accepting chemotaxis protein
VDQVNAGLAQIDQVTQSNTASAEESAAASSALSSQAQQLQETLKRFRLRDTGSQSQPTASAGKKLTAVQKPSHPLTEGWGMTSQRPKVNGRSAQAIELDDEEFGKF